MIFDFYKYYLWIYCVRATSMNKTLYYICAHNTLFWVKIGKIILLAKFFSSVQEFFLSQ